MLACHAGGPGSIPGRCNWKIFTMYVLFSHITTDIRMISLMFTLWFFGRKNVTLHLLYNGFDNACNYKCTHFRMKGSLSLRKFEWAMHITAFGRDI